MLRHVLGQTPYRRLSQGLILALLVLSPLSFSSDNIPNFAYECPLATSCASRAKRSIAVHQSSGVIAAVKRFSGSGRYGLPAPRIPVVELICSDSPSRSPPA